MATDLMTYARANRLVRDRVLAMAAHVWSTSAGYRDADVARLVRLIVPQVQAGQLQIASLTASYLTKASGTSAVSIPRSEILDARGVPASEVYRRPATMVYTELSKGASFSSAAATGAIRLASIIATDMQMAKVRAARTAMTSAGIHFYRRVLTGRENCALCLVASTQRYFVEDLMPIHPGCDCDSEELKDNQTPGQVIDRAALEATHENVEAFAGVSDRDARAPDYRQLIVTNEHGEIGPVLGWRGQKFTGPSDLT